jgi:putative heme-binding domain-containing protein
MKWNKLLCLFLLLIAATVIAGSGQDEISKLTSSDLERGKKLFVGHCAVCHGIEGVGDRGPSLNQTRLRHVTDDWSLFRVIKNGIEGSEMPATWQMTDREVWQVAGYIRSLGRLSPAKIAGDPVRGKAVYERQGCSICHIIGGEGETHGPELTWIGARRSAAYLRQALIDPDAESPAGFLVVSVKTRDGRNVRGVRLNEDSFTIQLRDDGSRLHSFRKSELKEVKKEFGASTMPAYTSMTAADLDDLIAYLASLRGEK